MQWKAALAVAVAAAAVAVPAAADVGATQTVETWSHVTGDPFYAGDGLCGSSTVAGYLVDGSGIARITETANGVYARGHSDDVWQLYEASGPPWDVTFGAYFGTLTVHVPFDELMPPNGQKILGNVANGRIVYPDGSSQALHILFRMVIPPGEPPKFFRVKFTCGG
jgi:hypothetical protein